MMKTFTFRYSPQEANIGHQMKHMLRASESQVFPHELVCADLKALLQVATESRLELFGIILKERPSSLYALAELAGKSQSYVFKEAKVLEALGLIRFVKEMDGGRERLRPEALYSKIVIDCRFEGPAKPKGAA